MFDPVTAVIGGGLGLVGSLIGGSQQADAATDAANIQANSANQANQLQYQMFQEQQKLMQPWVQSGQNNLARLNYAMYGQAPSAQSMILDPNSQEYKAWIAAHPQSPSGAASGELVRQAQISQQNYNNYLQNSDREGPPVAWWQPPPPVGDQSPSVGGQSPAAPTLYRNPLTGEISTEPPDMANQMGVQGGGLNPDWRFSTQDWKDSPEYAVYSGARDAAINRSQDALLAQGAASGMYGSGTMANALSQNMGQLYAQYDPQSLAAARQAAEAARTQEFDMLAGLSSPTGAQQVAQYAGIYGQNAGQNMIGAGNAQAAGQMGAANAWGNALTSGVNQIANAYGQYQGQQNFNQMLPYLNTMYGSQGYAAPQYSPYQSSPSGSHEFTPSGGGFYQV